MRAVPEVTKMKTTETFAFADLLREVSARTNVDGRRIPLLSSFMRDGYFSGSRTIRETPPAITRAQTTDVADIALVEPRLAPLGPPLGTLSHDVPQLGHNPAYDPPARISSGVRARHA